MVCTIKTGHISSGFKCQQFMWPIAMLCASPLKKNLGQHFVPFNANERNKREIFKTDKNMETKVFFKVLPPSPYTTHIEAEIGIAL